MSVKSTSYFPVSVEFVLIRFTMESHFADNLFKRLSFLARLIIPARQNTFFRNILIILYFSTMNGAHILSVIMHLVKFAGVETLQSLLFLLASATSIYKFVAVFLNINKLSHLADLIRQLDAEIHELTMQKYLKSRISTGNKICLIYVVNSFLNWFGGLFSAVISGKIIFPAWFPFDWQSSPPNYWIVVIYQTVSHASLIFQDAVSDLMRIIYVLIISGHFRVLGERISKIGYEEPWNLQGNYDELIACIRKHKIIIRILDELNRIISRTFFVVLLTVQINICIGLYFVLFTEGHFLLKSCLVSYVMSLFLLTTLQCYFGSEIEDHGERFMEAVYSCNWPNQDRNFKKVVLIVLTRSSRNVKIMAGGMIPVSLPTCLVVLKSSYSLFALLQHMNR